MGFTMLELLFVIAITGTLAAIAVPQSLRAADDFRTRSAARYLAHKLAAARFQSVRRSTSHGYKFEAVGADYRFTPVADGNHDGIRTADLLNGTDRVLGESDTLSSHFAGVSFGILDNVPDADGHAAGSSDGVRVGTGRIVTMNADGTASSGTLYVKGAARSQYAVRILGSTGRVRVLKFDAIRRRWADLT